MELSAALVRDIIRPYCLGEYAHHSRLDRGFMNYSFLVETSKGKYVLRIGKRTKRKEDILFEARLLAHLQNLPVPKYISDKEDNYVREWNGHNFAVYRYLEGEQPTKVTEELRREVARFLAKFHQQTRGLDTLGKRFAWYTFPDERISEFEQFLLKALPDYVEDIQYLVTAVREHRLPDSLPTGPLHCDVKAENILVKDGRLSGVIDFDNCQIGPYLLDLAIAITWFCTSEEHGLDKKCARRFASHYEKIRSLNAEERAHLEQAIRYAYASHELVDYYVYAKGIISEEYFEFGRRFHLGALRKLTRTERPAPRAPSRL